MTTRTQWNINGADRARNAQREGATIIIYWSGRQEVCQANEPDPAALLALVQALGRLAARRHREQQFDCHGSDVVRTDKIIEQAGEKPAA